MNDKNLNEMAISSQVFSKNGWKLIKKYREGNVYRALIECEKCNYQKIVNYYNFIDVKRTSSICTKCKNGHWAESEIGKIYGSVKILEFDHLGDIDKHGHVPIYFKTQCTKCDKITIRLFNKVQWNTTNGCKSCTYNTSFDNASFNYIHKVYKDGAKSRNIEWNITNDQFLSLIKQDCYYCGKPPEIRKHDYSANKEKFNGIDRINSSDSYTFDNCVTCCTMCNYMKQSYSQDDFLNQIERIHNNLEKKGSTTSREAYTQVSGNGECPEKDNDIV